jgi:hypothetical protein
LFGLINRGRAEMAAISQFPSATTDVQSDVRIKLEEKKSERPLALAYRINDFAKAVGIGRTTIYKLIAQGKIPR